MRYRLAVLTHGASAPLEETLRSFRERVSPAPSSVRVYADGAGGPGLVLDAFARAYSGSTESKDLPPGARRIAGIAPVGRLPFTFSATHPSRQIGFCAATRELWLDAIRGEEEFVFWLEHDFVFLRDVALPDLAAELADEKLAQIALCRTAANAEERAAGGLVASRPGAYSAQPSVLGGLYYPGVAWLRHRSYFTTTPSLMRREFMRENAFPTYSDQCEGRFGLELVARGYSFGLWGNGEPWVDHIGVRDGFGY